jgi:hypothetical protein
MFCRIRISFDKVLSVPGSERRGGALVGRSDKSDKSVVRTETSPTLRSMGLRSRAR